jgi:hypothetical protein
MRAKLLLRGRKRARQSGTSQRRCNLNNKRSKARSKSSSGKLSRKKSRNSAFWGRNSIESIAKEWIWLENWTFAEKGSSWLPKRLAWVQ